VKGRGPRKHAGHIGYTGGIPRTDVGIESSHPRKEAGHVGDVRGVDFIKVGLIALRFEFRLNELL
ncbi:MAG: hypothetical protein AAF975_09055, partial [Spirochaetota bacterium]